MGAVEIQPLSFGMGHNSVTYPSTKEELTMITVQTFNKALSAFRASGMNLREKAQELIAFGIAQANEHGDLGYLTRVMNVAREVKALPSTTIKDYIKLHVPGVGYVKLSDGTYGFKRDGQESFVGRCTMPTVPWYEWEGNNKNHTADVDLRASLKALVTRTKKALAEGKPVKGMTQAEADTMLAKVEALLA